MDKVVTGENTAAAPEISVIVPVYNAASFLPGCIESILGQTFHDFELLLVDDGSTDGSGAVCRSYAEKDSRVQYLFKPNGGVSSARNLGLDHASGRYVAFCDSDDYAGSDWLQSMYDAADGESLVVSSYIIRDGVPSSGRKAGLPPGESSVFVSASDILERLVRARLLQFVWNKLFVRTVITGASLRFDEDFTIFEDEYFVLGYLHASMKVKYVDGGGYVYNLPAGFYTKYDFSIDSFIKVVSSVRSLLDIGHGARGEKRRRTRLPSIVYWYKVALGRYAASHTFSECREKVKLARSLASEFHDGFFNHLSLRILPDRCIYLLLKRKRG